MHPLVPLGVRIGMLYSCLRTPPTPQLHPDWMQRLNGLPLRRHEKCR